MDVNFSSAVPTVKPDLVDFIPTPGIADDVIKSPVEILPLTVETKTRVLPELTIGNLFGLPAESSSIATAGLKATIPTTFGS